MLESTLAGNEVLEGIAQVRCRKDWKREEKEQEVRGDLKVG